MAPLHRSRRLSTFASLRPSSRDGTGAEGDRLRCLAGPAGPQWCSPQLMAGSMEIAQRYNGGFHMHAEETKLQALSCRQFLGQVGRLATSPTLGVLTDPTALAHCVWVDDHDIDLIGQAGTTVVHNAVMQPQAWQWLRTHSEDGAAWRSRGVGL